MAVTAAPVSASAAGQRAEPGADLHHPVARPDGRQAGDAADRVRVDDEVLPEGAARREAVTGHEVRRLARRERHQVTSTGSGACTGSPSWA